MNLGTMTVSLRADLSHLEAGLVRAQEMVSRAGESLGHHEQRLERLAAAARDHGAGTAYALSAAQGSMIAVAERWEGSWQGMGATADAALERVTRRFGGAMAAMVVDGEGLHGFWRGLWRGLAEVAFKGLLRMVLDVRGAAGAMRDALAVVGGGLLGGVGGLVGGVFGGLFKGVKKLFGFDNAVNDAWARTQGFDFGRHFWAGMQQAVNMPLGRIPSTLSPMLAAAGMGAVGSLRATSIQSGAFQVNIYAQNLDERIVRDAGGILADEVSRRLGWTDRRTGV